MTGTNNRFGYYGDRIGLVYFSSLQGFNLENGPGEFNRSGTLAPGILTYDTMTFLANLNNFRTPLGGASDIDL
jgi:hypothetical protein